MDELFYFAEELDQLDEASIKELLEKPSLGLLIHASHGIEVANMDDVILTVVYGPMKKSPGSPDSPAHVLRGTVEEEDGKTHEVQGIWTPHNQLVKATFQRLFFHKVTADYLIPEPEPIPEHFAVIFDLTKANNALQIAHKYPEEILRFAYFTSEVPEDAELVAKTPRRLEHSENRTL